MPPRTFTPLDLIQLPVLSADDTVALITELQTAAKAEESLSESISESLEHLVSSREAVADALMLRNKQAAVDPRVARDADLRVDTAWAATRDWMSAWTRIPAKLNPHHAAVDKLQAVLFSDKLNFLTLAFRKEWTQSEVRLQAIEDDGHAETFAALGGAVILKNLKQAHEGYGKALAITATPSGAVPEADVQDAREGALEALREYATQVAASAKRKDTASRARAERLLRPLSQWESSPRHSEADVAEGTPAGGDPNKPVNPPAGPTP